MRLWLKIVLVLGMTLAILVPLLMVRGVIHERQQYRAQAVAEIARSYAGAQRFMGPVVVVPYVDRIEAVETDKNGVERRVVREEAHQWTFFPTTLHAGGPMKASTKKRGLYAVRVYEWDAKANARFDVRIPQTPANRTGRRLGQPYLSYALSDVRGLIGAPLLRVDGRGVGVLEGLGSSDGPGIHARLAEVAPGAVLAFDTQLDFDLAGTESLELVPLGQRNTFALESAWPHPKFDGSFLPRTRDIDASGFRARWEIASVATRAQSQYLRGGRESADGGSGIDAVSVSLFDPVDIYTQADRATKYGLLFVLLTFVGFFLFELIKSLPIHPIQYALVGLALVVFFLLLVSLSEHIDFAIAYLIASVACIGLIVFYLSHVLRSALRAAGFGAMLLTLYGALYGLLVSEDNALVLGSGLLFLVLAAVMAVTRKVDWYQLASVRPTPPRMPAM